MKKHLLNKVFSDIFTNASFYTVLYGLVELFIMQLSLVQVAKIRGVAALFNIVTGPVMGYVREKWMALFKVTPKSSSLRKLFFDTLLGGVIGTTSYVFFMLITGIAFEEIVPKLPTMLLSSLLIGRFYGKYHDLVRRLFKEKSVL